MAKVGRGTAEKLDTVNAMLASVVRAALVDAPPWLDFTVVSGKRTEEEQQELNLLEIDEAFEKYMCSQIVELKAKRDQSAVDAALDKVREAAFRDENLMDTTMEAVKAYATLGELWDVYRERYGSFDEKSHITGI